MTKWSEFDSSARSAAIARATTKLAELGFSELADGTWDGNLTVDGDQFPVRIKLPEGFPDKLPEIYLSDADNAPCQAHLEQSGKLCIAATSGNLLDVDRSEALIEQSLERASSILRATPEEQSSDLQLEFVSYWPDKDSDVVFISIADPDGGSREIVLSDCEWNGTRLLFANSENDLKSWTRRIGAQYANISKTFLVQLSLETQPPRFSELLTTEQFQEFLKANMADEEFERWRKWDHGRRPPIAVLLSKPLPDGSWAVFGIRSAVLSDQQKQALQNPFKRKKPPVKSIRSALQGNPIGRRKVSRADRAHLLNRTIGTAPFHDFKVAVIGCGAVGSQIALAVAATGAQSIALIDHDVLEPENVHRHVLGLPDVGRHKADALAEHLTNRFAQIEVAAASRPLEALLENEPDSLDEIDIAVIAFGDDTLERRLNRYLGPNIVRVHAWIEPLGLGGHCLTVPGHGHKGCFECLYARDETGQLYNMASLCAPGQDFQRTTGGCAGTFTPFGFADTLDAAARALRAMITVSNATTMQAELTSWIGQEGEFLANGHVLSQRGKELIARREERRIDVFQGSCSVCTAW